MMYQVLLTEIVVSSSALSNDLNTTSVSKWTITSEVGDNDSDCYEVTLWYMTYVLYPRRRMARKQLRKPLLEIRSGFGSNLLKICVTDKGAARSC